MKLPPTWSGLGLATLGRYADFSVGAPPSKPAARSFYGPGDVSSTMRECTSVLRRPTVTMDEKIPKRQLRRRAPEMSFASTMDAWIGVCVGSRRLRLTKV